jgi:hypothetical protein
VRRKLTNNTGASVTRLRVRITDITTFPAGIYVLPGGATCGDPGTECAADLRALTSSSQVISVGGNAVTIQGTTLEQASAGEAQSNGGGYNSSLSAGTVTLGTPLAAGGSINLGFLFGVQQRGPYRFGLIVEALP